MSRLDIFYEHALRPPVVDERSQASVQAVDLDLSTRQVTMIASRDDNT